MATLHRGGPPSPPLVPAGQLRVGHVDADVRPDRRRPRAPPSPLPSPTDFARHPTSPPYAEPRLARHRRGVHPCGRPLAQRPRPGSRLPRDPPARRSARVRRSADLSRWRDPQTTPRHNGSRVGCRDPLESRGHGRARPRRRSSPPTAPRGGSPPPPPPPPPPPVPRTARPRPPPRDLPSPQHSPQTGPGGFRRGLRRFAAWPGSTSGDGRPGRGTGRYLGGATHRAPQPTATTHTLTNSGGRSKKRASRA